jgi:hypothetical protein
MDSRISRREFRFSGLQIAEQGADMWGSVWQSLKPEADRLGKLAEWEKEFSQVRPLTFLSGPLFKLKEPLRAVCKRPTRRRARLRL